MQLRIPAKAHVLVCDGGKALLLQNLGDEMFPNLQTAWVREASDNPRTAELGTDRPSRVFESVGNRRSAAEQPDYHARREEEFARSVAEHLHGMREEGQLTALVLIAPPKMLADLRTFSDPMLKSVTIAEMNKDLTKLTAYQIEQYLTAA